MDHGNPRSDASREDFYSSYRRLTSSIARQGGITILTVTKDASGAVAYHSEPVPLPTAFEVSPDDDGILWQQIQALRKGGSLQVKISAEDAERWRVSILSSDAEGGSP